MELSNNLDTDPITNPIIIDTNGLLMPFQFSINLDLELNRLFGFWLLLVPQCVITELIGLSKDNHIAKVALDLSRKYKKIETDLWGDDGVLEALEKANGILLTNDKELKKRAIDLGYRVIYLRKRKYLVVSGE